MSWKAVGSVMRAAALGAVMLLVAVAVGCGGSDGDGDGAQASAGEAGSERDGQRPADRPGELQPDAGSPEAEVQRAHASFVEVYYQSDIEAICEALSRSAQRRFGDGQSCERRMRDARNSGSLSENRPYLVRIQVDGRRAATRAKTKNSRAYPLPFVKEDGAWKVDGGF